MEGKVCPQANRKQEGKKSYFTQSEGDSSFFTESWRDFLGLVLHLLAEPCQYHPSHPQGLVLWVWPQTS